MNIGQASKISGVSMKTIRRYEDVGLLTGIKRRPNDYRDYSVDDVQRLTFIRRARALGFSLDRIRTLLTYWSNTSRTCHEVREIALQHVRELEARAALLREMTDTLRQLADSCDGSDGPDCPIIARLADGVGIDKAAALEIEQLRPLSMEQAHLLGSTPRGDLDLPMDARPPRQRRRAALGQEPGSAP